MPLPTVKVRGASKEVITIQGGMGAGISLAKLAAAVARRGWTGIVSGVALDHFVGQRIGHPISHRKAARLEIERAKHLSEGLGAIGVNCLAAMRTTYRDTIQGAIEGGVDAVFVGAGLPQDLPEIVRLPEITRGWRAMLVPIVSSAKALELICRHWKRYQRIPDAVVLEGPQAGGHLGFKFDQIDKPEFQLDQLLPDVLEVAQKCAAVDGNPIPVIVAGGVWDLPDIVKWVDAGADGTQHGTRFAATDASNASPAFKKAIVDAASSDVILATNPDSPAGYPFRVINTENYREAIRLDRPLECEFGYMLYKDHCGRWSCRAFESTRSFCICNGLLAATDRNPTKPPIYTVGTNADRVVRIMAVDELVDELTGFTS